MLRYTVPSDSWFEELYRTLGQPDRHADLHANKHDVSVEKGDLHFGLVPIAMPTGAAPAQAGVVERAVHAEKKWVLRRAKSQPVTMSIIRLPHTSQFDICDSKGAVLGADWQVLDC